MSTGFYAAASGMLMQQRSLNAIANNMANDATPGFKTEQVVSSTFEQELMTRQEGANSGRIGKGTPVRIVQDVPTKFDPSLLQETGRPFDLAINGEGFFTVQGGDGEQYLTRNGNFDVDAEGFLVLPGAGRVLGKKGEINLKGASNFTVDQDGTVYDVQGRRLDTLVISVPREGTKLAKFANGMFRVNENPPILPQPPGAVPLPGEEVVDVNAEAALPPGLITVGFPDIRQGVLEGSNVDWNREMSMLMETQRTFQACSKALQEIDKINQRAVEIAAQ